MGPLSCGLHQESFVQLQSERKQAGAAGGRSEKMRVYRIWDALRRIFFSARIGEIKDQIDAILKPQGAQ